MENVDQAQLSRWVNTGIAVTLVVCAVLILLGRVGYGKLETQLPDGSTLRVNSKVVGPHETIRLHHGTYSVALKSPAYSAAAKQVSVGYFATKTITADSFSKRQPQDILSSILGSYGSYGPPTFSQTKWLLNDQWLAGLAGPGSFSPIALHFTKGEWRVAYFDEPSYDHAITLLPPEVMAYVQQLEAKND